MIPLNQLSTTPLFAEYTEKSNNLNAPLVDYELGGVGLNNPTEGLKVKIWTLYMVGKNVTISAEGVEPTTLFEWTGISELSLAFDQNMRPFVAFVALGQAKYWWFDTTIAAMRFSDLPLAVTPRCTLDDKRLIAGNTSDIILAYVRGNNLYMRYQRDRFTIEYTLKLEVNGTLVTIGMTKNNRIKFRLRRTQSTF